MSEHSWSAAKSKMNLGMIQQDEVMNQFGNLLADGQYLCDTAHQDMDYKYMRPTNDGICPFVNIPDELTKSIFTMAIREDLSTQSILYYTLQCSNTMAKWAPNLIFENENEIDMKTIFNNRFMGKQGLNSALRIILHGFNVCRPQFRKAYLFMCDSLAQGYTTLFNWQITNIKTSYIFFHQILNSKFGDQRVKTIKTVETREYTDETKLFYEKKSEYAQLKKKLMDGFDPFISEEEHAQLVAKYDAVLNQDHEPQYRTMIVARDSTEVKSFKTRFNFHINDINMVNHTANAMSQIFTGLLVSSLITPLVGEPQDFSQDLELVKHEMRTTPSWEWSFINKDLKALLLNRKIQLPNIFDLCDTEWSELLQGRSDSSLFVRTHAPVSDNLIHTQASCISFLLRQQSIPEDLWWPGDDINIPYQLSILAIRAGNINLLQYLYRRGWFAMPKCRKLETMISIFPNILQFQTTKNAIQTSSEIALYKTLIISAFTCKRYQTHTLLNITRPEIFYKKHIAAMVNLVYSLVEPYFFIASSASSHQLFTMRIQDKLGMEDGLGSDTTINMAPTLYSVSGIKTYSDMIIKALVDTDQWDMVQWLGKLLAPFCQSKGAAETFKKRNKLMLQAQMWIANSVLKAIKDQPSYLRTIPMLEWVRTNLYNLFRNIMEETRHFHNKHFGPNSFTDTGQPFHLYGREFVVWLNLAWFTYGGIDDDEEDVIPRRWDRTNSTITSMGKSIQDYLGRLRSDALGMPLYRYLVQDLSVQSNVPYYHNDLLGYDVIGCTPLVMEVDTDKSVIPSSSEMPVGERISGIAMAMVHDLLLAMQRNTSAVAPLTPWALDHFDWRTLEILNANDMNVVKSDLNLFTFHKNDYDLDWILKRIRTNTREFSPQMQRIGNNARYLQKPIPALAYVFILEHFMGLSGVNTPLPGHLKSLCDSSKSPTLFQMLVRKMFPLLPQDYLVFLPDYISTHTLNGEAMIWFFNRIAIEFWTNLSKQVIHCYSTWTKIYLPNIHRFDEHNRIFVDSAKLMYTNSTLPKMAGSLIRLGNTSLPDTKTIFSSMAKLPENLLTFYAQRDHTQRLNVMNQLMEQLSLKAFTTNTEKEKLVEFMVCLHYHAQTQLRKPCSSDFINERSINFSILTEIMATGNFDFIHWFHGFYFAPTFLKDFDAYNKAIDRYVKTLSTQANPLDLAAMEQAQQNIKGWQQILLTITITMMQSGHYSVIDFLRNDYRTLYKQRDYKQVKFCNSSYTIQHFFGSWSVFENSGDDIQTYEPMIWKGLWELELGKTRMNKYLHPDIPVNCGPNVPLLIMDIDERERCHKNHKRRKKRNRSESTDLAIESAKKKLKKVIDLTTSIHHDDDSGSQQEQNSANNDESGSGSGSGSQQEQKSNDDESDSGSGSDDMQVDHNLQQQPLHQQTDEDFWNELIDS